MAGNVDFVVEVQFRSAMSIYSALATTVNALLKPLRYQVTRLPTPPMNCRIEAIRRFGIEMVFDVGANAGQYATELRHYGYQGRILSFEPLPDAFASLQRAAAGDPLWETVNEAAGEAPAKLPMHVSDNSVSSSLLKVTEASIAAAPDSRAGRVVDVAVEPLRDRLLAAKGRLMLKIDTQGYEWPVLMGAGDALRNVTLLDVEMSLTPLYADQKLFDEVDKYIRSNGFRFYGIDTSFWNRATGELLGLDGIYVRETDA